MAEFALGLTKTAVEGTLSLVKSAVEEEAELREKVQKDLVFITGEFEMMRSFLRVANMERTKNEVVLTWVRQLRNLAFDVEDCVELVVHLDNKSRWRASLRRLWHTVYCCAPPLPLDVAVADIKQLKARVEDVSQRNTRYNLINDSGSNSMTVTPPQEQSACLSPAFHMVTEVWEAAGKLCGTSDLQKLIQCAPDSLQLQVVSVWGCVRVDLGVPHIIRSVYTNHEVCKDFTNRAWIKVVHPFNCDEFLSSLLTQFYTSSCQAYAGIDIRARIKAAVALEDIPMKAELMKLVNEQRYLVVLEDLSTVEEWHAIRMYLPDTQNGSRIIVSTKQLGTALFCTGEPYQVSRISQDQHICALFKEGFGRRSARAEFFWQLRHPGVMSVYDKDRVFSSLHGDRSIMKQEFDGVKLEHRGWAYAPQPSRFRDFSKKLLGRLEPANQSDKFDKMEESDPIRKCREFLHKNHCLVVINNLNSTHDWDSIKETFLSESVKACIVVTTTVSLDVAKHCPDKKYRVFNAEDLEATIDEDRLSENRREVELYWENNTELIGRDRRKITFRDGNGDGVISIWGIASVGKSALGKSFYYYELVSVSKHFKGRFKFFSWVDVSRPFTLPDFFRRLLLDFHSDNIGAKEIAAVGIMEGQDPMEECRKIQRQGRCLVVIDGLQSTYDWDSIKTAFLSTTCILVITREESVARHCADKQERVINVKGLETDAALRLFMKVASMEYTDETQMKLSEHIVAKCGGLPGVITAVGKHVQKQTTPKYILNSLNDDFMRKLETDPDFHGLKGLFSWMHSYFDACPDDLKPCIFYLSVFPADSDIRRRRLQRRWIAEGYSRDTAGGTAEKKGEKFFSELVKLTIIQQTPNEVLCQVNGFFHEYISSRPMEDNLVFALEGRCSLNSQRTGQHLTIRSCWDRDKTVFESLDFSRLRSFTVFGEWRPFFMSKIIKMRKLRVLDLEDTSGLTNDDLEQIAKLVPRLKLLSLRGCREITHLPNSVGDLRQLQTLDVRHTSIVTLPHAVIKLQKLQYIRAGTEPWDEGGMVTSSPETDQGRTPPPVEDGSTCKDMTPTPSGDGLIDEDMAPTPVDEFSLDEHIPAEDGDGTAQCQAAAAEPSEPAETGVVGTSPPSRNWPHTLVSGWLSKLRSRCQLDNDGVKVPIEIGKLVALHTLGVVNVSGARGKAFLKELNNLTQLRKLGVSGINQDNYLELFSAIKGHGHLESLSVQLEADKQGWSASLDDVHQPPKSLKSLKLYGYVHKMPIWIKQLDHLEKLELEMTTETQGDIDVVCELPPKRLLRRLCVKPIGNHIDPEGLSFCLWNSDHLRVLKIVSSSSLLVSFDWLDSVELLILDCTSGPSFTISGLKKLCGLKEVWLKGSYSEALKQDLQRQIDSKNGKKPVLKLEKPRSS